MTNAVGASGAINGMKRLSATGRCTYAGWTDRREGGNSSFFPFHSGFVKLSFLKKKNADPSDPFFCDMWCIFSCSTHCEHSSVK